MSPSRCKSTTASAGALACKAVQFCLVASLLTNEVATFSPQSAAGQVIVQLRPDAGYQKLLVESKSYAGDEHLDRRLFEEATRESVFRPPQARRDVQAVCRLGVSKGVAFVA